MNAQLPTDQERRAMDKVWQAIPSASMPSLERMIEIIEAQAEEIERLRSELEGSQ